MADPVVPKELKDPFQTTTFKVPAASAEADLFVQNMGLSDLARGLQYVVNETAMAAYLHLQRTLDLFFDEKGVPISRDVQLPDGSFVAIPLLALTPPANLVLDEMEVALAVRIDSMKPVSDVTPKPGTIPPKPGAPQSAKAMSFSEPLIEDNFEVPPKPLARLSFEVSPAPRSPDADARKDNNIMDIKMVFRRDDSPEGVARLVAMFTDAMFRAKDKPSP